MDAAPSRMPPADRPARVVTWNLCVPCRTRAPAYAGEIGPREPDVLGLQEVCTRRLTRFRRQVEARYRVRYHLAPGPVRRHPRCGFPQTANYGNALMSRTPIEDVEIVRYSRGGSEPRGYLSATTTIDGLPTRVFVTHLAQAAQAEIRVTQVAELLQAVARHDRVLVLADLNTEPFSPELRPLWATLRDVDPLCGTEPDPGIVPTADASPRRKKFDYILLRGLTCEGFTVDGSRHSDHDLVTGFLRQYGSEDLPR